MKLLQKIQILGSAERPVEKPIVASSQDHLPIADISDDLVLYKTGGAAIVMESSSLNFGLLSDREQEAVIAAYAALINSLSFPIQIVVRTQRKDITQYISFLDASMQKIQNQKLRALMASYKGFIEETIKKKNVLGKRFFIVIPFYPYELGVVKAFKFGERQGPLPYSKDYVIKKAKIALWPKKDHLSRQAARLGIKLRQLPTEELVHLYYDIYNPNLETIKNKEEAKLE